MAVRDQASLPRRPAIRPAWSRHRSRIASCFVSIGIASAGEFASRLRRAAQTGTSMPSVPFLPNLLLRCRPCRAPLRNSLAQQAPPSEPRRRSMSS